MLIENPGYSKDYMLGFKFRGLNNPDIFFDDNHKRMTQNYRNGFIRLAVYYLNYDRKSDAIAVLDEMNEKLPYKNLGIETGLLFEIANLYLDAGSKDKYEEFAVDIEKQALASLDRNPKDVESYYNPYRILLETYENLNAYEKAIGIWEKLKEMYPNDPTIEAGIKKYQNLIAQRDSSAK